MDSNNVSDAARVGLKVTRTALRVSAKLAGKAIGAAIKLAQARAASKRVATASTTSRPPVPAASAPPVPAASAPPVPANSPASTNGAQPASPVGPGPTTPPDEVVADSADAGAEAGAGAELHLEEPWAGYAAQNVETIKARIADAGAADLAVLELYEQAHKQRKTVLEAAQRRLKHLSPPDGA